MHRCLYCGHKLRKVKNPQPHHASLYGDYGDGHFCGLRCGYFWAVVKLKLNPLSASEQHARMNAHVAANGHLCRACDGEGKTYPWVDGIKRTRICLRCNGTGRNKE